MAQTYCVCCQTTTVHNELWEPVPDQSESNDLDQSARPISGEQQTKGAAALNCSKPADGCYNLSKLGHCIAFLGHSPRLHVPKFHLYITTLCTKKNNRFVVKAMKKFVVSSSQSILWRSKCTFNIPLQTLQILCITLYRL
jgi:hypothetical protein